MFILLLSASALLFYFGYFLGQHDYKEQQKPYFQLECNAYTSQYLNRSYCNTIFTIPLANVSLSINSTHDSIKYFD